MHIDNYRINNIKLSDKRKVIVDHSSKNRKILFTRRHWNWCRCLCTSCENYIRKDKRKILIFFLTIMLLFVCCLI